MATSNQLRNLLLRNVTLSAAGQEPEIDEHPNKMRFRGILVRVDEPSDRPPNGSDGHKIYVPADVAEKRLDSLVGMGLNYDGDKFAGHNQRHKVGTIQKAWLDGKDVWVEGHIWVHDFPEAKQDLKQNGKLGMSMEIGNVHVEDVDADVWKLTDFYFMGATILFKNAAAYSRTAAIAAKAQERSSNTMKKPVAKPVSNDVATIAAAATKAVSDTLGPMVNELLQRMERMEVVMAASGLTDNISAEDAVPDLKTKEHAEPDGDECAACNEKKGMKAEGDEGEEEEFDEDEEMESATDKGGLADMGSKLQEDANSDDTPGNFNKGAKNKGDQTTAEDKTGSTVTKAVTGSAAIEMVKKMAKRIEAQSQEIKGLRAKLEKYSKTAIKASAEMGRRSSVVLPNDVQGLLKKNNLDPIELSASGAKLTVSDVDAIIASINVPLDTTKKMEIKNQLLKAGLMEDGAVRR